MAPASMPVRDRTGNDAGGPSKSGYSVYIVYMRICLYAYMCIYVYLHHSGCDLTA